MDSLVRIVVEPYFENILKRISELDKKINSMDAKIRIIEKDVFFIGCRIGLKTNSSLLESNSKDVCKMEEVD